MSSYNNCYAGNIIHSAAVRYLWAYINTRICEDLSEFKEVSVQLICPCMYVDSNR